MLNRPLINIGQHGICATEGKQGRLGEKPADLGEYAVPAKAQEKATHSSSPDGKPRGGHAKKLRTAKHGMGRRGRMVVDPGWYRSFSGISMSTRGGEMMWREAAAEIADQTCGENNKWKR